MYLYIYKVVIMYEWCTQIQSYYSQRDFLLYIEYTFITSYKFMDNTIKICQFFLSYLYFIIFITRINIEE